LDEIINYPNQDIPVDTNSNLTQFKILELWPETIVSTSIKCLLGRLSEIKYNDFGLQHDYMSFDNIGSIFILLHDCDLAYYLRNVPEDPKGLDLNEFMEGTSNIKGVVYKAYYHKDYLIEAAKKFGEYYHYSQEYDKADVFNKFEINLKKINYQISACPLIGNYSLGEFSIYFSLIDNFFVETLSDSRDRFISKNSGLFSLEIVFLKTPPRSLITNLSFFGFSITELQKILQEMKNQIIDICSKH
jgi:hypothetical protein